MTSFPSRSRPVRAPVPSIWCSCDRPKAAVFLVSTGAFYNPCQAEFYQGCKCCKFSKPCHEFRISPALQHEFRCHCLRILKGYSGHSRLPGKSLWKSTASRWCFWLILLECIHLPGLDCHSRLGRIFVSKLHLPLDDTLFYRLCHPKVVSGWGHLSSFGANHILPIQVTPWIRGVSTSLWNILKTSQVSNLASKQKDVTGLHRFLYNNSPAHQARNRFGDWRWFDVEGWRMESWPSPPYWNYVPLLKASEQLVVEGWKRREKGPCTLDNMGIFRKQWRVEAQVVVQGISMIWRIFLQVDRQEK